MSLTAGLLIGLYCLIIAVTLILFGINPRMDDEEAEYHHSKGDQYGDLDFFYDEDLAAWFVRSKYGTHGPFISSEEAEQYVDRRHNREHR